MWQDRETGKGKLTQFFEWSHNTIDVEILEGQELGAAIKGKEGEIIYFTTSRRYVVDGNKVADAYMYRINYQG